MAETSENNFAFKADETKAASGDERPSYEKCAWSEPLEQALRFFFCVMESNLKTVMGSLIGDLLVAHATFAVQFAFSSFSFPFPPFSFFS